jgi:hypothetical protein
MKCYLWIVPALLLLSGCTGKSLEDKLAASKKLRVQVSGECVDKYDTSDKWSLMAQDERCKALAKVEKPLCEKAMKSKLITGEECENDEWLVWRATAWDMSQPFLG